MKNIKTNSILLFMKSKGWTEIEKGSFYHVMKPPAGDKGFQKDARFYVPREEAEGTTDYLRSVEGLLESLAYLYYMEVPELVMLFSKPVASGKMKEGERIRG